MRSLQPIWELDEAWDIAESGPRLRAIRTAGERLRESFANGPRCHAVRTLPLTTLPYPLKYALNGAAIAPYPFVTLTHRALLVQFFVEGELKHLLFNPTDIEAARATPFFARLEQRYGARMTKLLQKRFDPLETQLARLNIKPEHIDYVAFDHFHTQDLRGLLGTTNGGSPRFPRAKLITPHVEWNDWDDLHPLQRAWFVRDGKSLVIEDNVIFSDRDVMLGDGVMLLRTPGHTTGNQTLFLNTSEGVWGTSENGTSADNWSPHDSKIRGVSQTSRSLDVEVILNANTPELAATQYTSMVLEKTIVDRVRRAPAFVQMFPSSEITPSVIAPGIAPTLIHRALTVGQLAAPREERAA